MLLDILDKLMLIISFTFISLILAESNIVPTILSRNKVINIRKYSLIWFFIGFFVSGFFVDMTDAVMLFPIAIQFTKYLEKKDREYILLSLVFGICTGGDLTVFGANDNLIALGLLEDVGINLSYLDWTKWFIIPTLIMGICIAGYMYFLSENKEIKLNYDIQKVDKLKVLIVILLIISAFIIDTIVLFITSLILVLLNVKDRKKLLNIPYRALVLWTFTFIVGKYINTGLKAMDLNLPNLSMFIIIIVLSFVTNFTTNSSLTAIALPLVLAMYPNNTLMAMVAIKAISTSYFTMFGNSCLAIANGYGISQKVMLKHGLIVTAISIIIQMIYFNVLQLIT